MENIYEGLPEKLVLALKRCDLLAGPEQLEYFIDTDIVRHIDSWQYSPPNCKKVIETVFV